MNVSCPKNGVRTRRPTIPKLGALILSGWLAGCAAPVQKTEAPRVDRALTVLVSDDVPAFTTVAEEIRKRYAGKLELIPLQGRETLSIPVRQRISAAPAPVVVAVGLSAARAAKTLPEKKVIFCQTFNYEDERLASPSTKGVSAMAPVREQFRAWKTLAPRLKRVGVITGKNLDWLLDAAGSAAKENRIELVHVQVRSDKETLYAYKKLSQDIQGLWLVPDNRVLSRDTLRDVMGHSVRHGIQVLVTSRELLGLGALLSAESRPADVAEQVLARVRQAQESEGLPGPDIVPLTQADLRINAVMAKRLRLVVPKELAARVYQP